MRIEEYDLRTGGRYRYLHVSPDGSFGFRGVFHVARPGEIVIQTFEYDGFPDVVSLETLRFEDVGGGRTRISGSSVYPSLEARDGMVASGMGGGVAEGYERLDELLTTL